MELKDWIPILVPIVLFLVGSLVLIIWNSGQRTLKEQIEKVETNAIDTAKRLETELLQSRTDFSTRAAEYTKALETRLASMMLKLEALQREQNAWELASSEAHSKLWQALPANYVTKEDFNRGMDALEKLFSQKIDNLTRTITNR